MRLLEPTSKKAAPVAATALGVRFDPFDPEYQADPYPRLAEVQEQEPVLYAPAIDSWIVTRHATIRSVLKDTQRFSPSIASDPLVPLCPMARQRLAQSDFDVPGLLVNNGGANHPQYRRFFGEPLKPQRTLALKPFVIDTVDAQIDRMLAAGPTGDLATGITWDVPALVLFRMLGIPDADVPVVKDYADSRVVMLWGRPTPEEQIRLTEGAIAFFHYTRDLVEHRLAEPRDDYPSDLIRQRDGDDAKATIRDIVGVTFNLLFAGHETTSSASANILSAILARPALWERIVKGDIDLPRLVEEGLRFDPPVQAWRRLATEAVELDGVAIPAGAHLLLHFAAANRDPAKFDDSQAFIPDRANAAQHLSFGMGAHFCLGAPLAKLEITTMIERLAAKVPTLSAVPGQAGDYLPNTSFRGLRRLPVTW